MQRGDAVAQILQQKPDTSSCVRIDDVDDDIDFDFDDYHIERV